MLMSALWSSLGPFAEMDFEKTDQKKTFARRSEWSVEVFGPDGAAVDFFGHLLQR